MRFAGSETKLRNTDFAFMALEELLALFLRRILFVSLTQLTANLAVYHLHMQLLIQMLVQLTLLVPNPTFVELISQCQYSTQRGHRGERFHKEHAIHLTCFEGRPENERRRKGKVNECPIDHFRVITL